MNTDVRLRMFSKPRGAAQPSWRPQSNSFAATLFALAVTALTLGSYEVAQESAHVGASVVKLPVIVVTASRH